MQAAGEEKIARRHLIMPPTAPGMVVGLFGGSFNPPHAGHELVSEIALRRLNLDQLWWMVTPGNPLKDHRQLAPLAERIRLSEEIVPGPRVKVTAFEKRLGQSYTARTLERVQALNHGLHFIWIMGADNLAQFHQWRQWRDIARLMPIAVVARPGYDADARAAVAMGWLRAFVRPPGQWKKWTDWRPPALVFLRFPPDPRSATRLRQADPRWFTRFASRAQRDPVTHHPLPEDMI